MFNTFYVEKVGEDGTKYEIRIRFDDKDNKFILDDIGMKQKRKRNFTYLSGIVRDDYSYRSLEFDQRYEYKVRFLLSKCPVKLVNEALEESWLSCKPELFSESE